MSGTRMDRLQNQVTGSILLNVIENTAKLNKKTTSSSSISNEDLKALQTKVNQMSSTVAQASTKADAAKSTAEAASTKADAASANATAAKSTAETASANASAAQSTAELASTNATAAQSTAETASTKADTASSKAQEALTGLQTIQTNAVFKNPDGGAAQTINGELKASDFKSGDVSLVGLSNNVVLKNPSAAQTINGDITLTGNLTTGNLTIPLITSDQSNLKLGDGSRTVKLLGDTIIGKGGKGDYTSLEVYGGIKAYGDMSVQKADPDAPTDPRFTSKVIITQDIHHTSDTTGTLITLSKTGVTIGKSESQMTKRTLQVHGNTTIGSSTDSADLTVNGNMTIASGGGEASMLTSENIATEYISRTSNPDITLISLDASGVNIGAVNPEKGERRVMMLGDTTIGTTSKNYNLTVNGAINLGRLNISYAPSTGVITFHDSTSGKTATITLN